MNFSWPHKAAGKGARGRATRVRAVAITAVAAAAAAGVAVPAIAATANAHAPATAKHQAAPATAKHLAAPAAAKQHAAPATAKHSTTTTMSAVTGYVGVKLTLAAQVKGGPTPTGWVEFIYGGKALCSGALSGGKAHCAHAFASAGSFRVEAYYEGTLTHKPSSAKATVLVLALGRTVTAVTATPADPYPGQAVTLSATVTSSSAATGKVTFSDGAGTLCSATLAGGKASCAYTWDAAGADGAAADYTVTGKYSGDAKHAGSSGTAAVAVTPVATTTAITNPDPFTQASGVPWDVDVTVTDNTAGDPAPTGTVEVYSLAQPGLDPPLPADVYTCTFDLTATDDGSGSCPVTTPAGAYGFVEFEAVFNADYANPQFGTSTSTGEHKLINPIPTTTTVAPDTGTEGTAVDLVATVTPEDGGDLLTAYSDIPDVVNFTITNSEDVTVATCTGEPITYADATGNTADCSFTPTADDTYTVTATFPGDEYAAASTGTETLTVTGGDG